MHFAKNLSSFVVGGLLATTAVAELTKAVRGGPVDAAAVVRRDTPSLNVLLHKREEKEVKQNNWDSGQGYDVLWTTGLLVCQGIAITGNAPEGIHDRWLSHSDASGPAKLSEMVADVQNSLAAGMTDMVVQLVFMDPATDDDREFATQLNREVEVALAPLGSFVPFYHPANVPHELRIESDKSISFPEAEYSEDSAEDMLEAGDAEDHFDDDDFEDDDMEDASDDVDSDE